MAKTMPNFSMLVWMCMWTSSLGPACGMAERRLTNQGWPLDNYNNASVWLMWMTFKLTKGLSCSSPDHCIYPFFYLEKLLAESCSSREEMIILTLPYVALPHRVRPPH